MSVQINIDESYLPFADTAILKLTLESYLKTRSIRSTSKELDCNRSTISRRLHKIKKNKKSKPIEVSENIEETNIKSEITDFMYVEKTSEMTRNKEGLPVWTSKRIDKQAQEKHLLSAIENSLKNFKFKAKVPESKITDADPNIMPIYQWGDPHFGMYAWERETGESYNLELGTALYLEAMRELVSRSPKTKIAMLNDLGDLLHREDDENKTRKSGHALDVSGRWAESFEASIFCLIEAVNIMLTKHEKVIVRINPGNHDPYGAITLGMALKGWLSNTDRVEVIDPNLRHWAYLHGKTMVFTYHGDELQNNRVFDVVMTDYRHMISRSTYTYAYHGHIHDERIQTKGGIKIESFPTLCARDVYATNYGFRNKRAMVCCYLDKVKGDVGRNVFNYVGQ